MNAFLRGRCRNTKSLNEEKYAQLIYDVWIYFLKENEGDHLSTLQDIGYALNAYEEAEEYEICAVLNQIIENYQQLSRIELRYDTANGQTYHKGFF